jgi:hypothetical protein
MARIAVSTPFKILSWTRQPPYGFNVNSCSMKYFATGGGAVYDVLDDVASSWWAAQFSTVVDPATTPTATFSVVTF